MRIDFPYYQGIPPLEVPDSNLIGVYEPPCVEATAPETALIHRAFDNPIGRPPIRRAASDARNALVITDDYTRNTPVRPILDRLMAELEGKISSQPQITIINNPEWVELRTVIITALDPYPQAREAVVNAIRGR